jgi:hypothetical protein
MNPWLLIAILSGLTGAIVGVVFKGAQDNHYRRTNPLAWPVGLPAL